MHESHPLGTVARLWRYPVKSLAAEELERSAVTGEGFEGDRRDALFVATAGHVRAGHTYRGKENRLLHTVATAARARDLAAERDVELDVRDGGPHFDAGTVSLVTDTWIDELSEVTGMRLDPLRFRPNIFVHAAPGFVLGEAALVGRRIAIGGTLLAVSATIKRCVTITYDIATGVADPRVSRATARYRDNVMGVYCDVVTPGTIARGDTATFSAFGR